MPHTPNALLPRPGGNGPGIGLGGGAGGARLLVVSGPGSGSSSAACGMEPALCRMPNAEWECTDSRPDRRIGGADRASAIRPGILVLLSWGRRGWGLAAQPVTSV